MRQLTCTSCLVSLCSYQKCWYQFLEPKALFLFRTTVYGIRNTAGGPQRNELIKHTEQGVDDSSNKLSQKSTSRHTYISANTSAHAALFVVFAIALLVPLSVHAGMFSSLVQFLSAPETAVAFDDETDASANHTPLLSASRNPDAVGAVGGGDVFVSDDALISSGPIGEDEIQAFSRSGGEISVYIVDEGDSLSQIADMYGVTVNTIVWANDLSGPSDIHEGDTLVILPIAGVRHTVAKGETLSDIVDEYEADFDEVLQYNNLATADDLSVGDELIIPGGNMHTAVTVAARPTPTSSSGSSASVGSFSHPVPGAIRTQGIHGYNGVDFALPGGASAPILAAAAGEVIVSKSGGWNGGYGTYVVIKHNNGTQTLYAHLNANYVSVGEWVSTGEQIGTMGNTGRSTGTHLHFEVRGTSNPF